MKVQQHSKIALLPLISLFLLVSGCAIGNQYRFKDENVGLPLMPAEKGMAVAVSVSDQRPYVLSGNKTDRFVGLQRGGFGNPFDVTTSSGRPFVEDVLRILTGMLQRSGYTVDYSVENQQADAFVSAFKGKDIKRGVMLDIREWKTDVLMRVTLHYNLMLTVVDENGTTLATSTQSGTEAPGGARYSESGNAEIASRELSTKLSYLFMDPQVQAALQ